MIILQIVLVISDKKGMNRVSIINKNPRKVILRAQYSNLSPGAVSYVRYQLVNGNLSTDEQMKSKSKA